MFGFSGTVRFYYCPVPVNMRKSFDGLAGAAEEWIHQDPESDHAFVFFGKTRKLVKILQWDGDGFVLYAKRLECGSFHVPKTQEGKIELSFRGRCEKNTDSFFCGLTSGISYGILLEMSKIRRKGRFHEKAVVCSLLSNLCCPCIR